MNLQPNFKEYPIEDPRIDYELNPYEELIFNHEAEEAYLHESMLNDDLEEQIIQQEFHEFIEDTVNYYGVKA